MKKADLVIMAGAIADFRLDYGRVLSKRSKIVAVNRSGKDLRQNTDLFWKPALASQSDPGDFVRQLAGLFDAPTAGALYSHIRITLWLTSVTSLRYRSVSWQERQHAESH